MAATAVVITWVLKSLWSRMNAVDVVSDAVAALQKIWKGLAQPDRVSMG